MMHSYHVKKNKQVRKKETSSSNKTLATEATTRLYLQHHLASFLLVCLARRNENLTKEYQTNKLGRYIKKQCIELEKG